MEYNYKAPVKSCLECPHCSKEETHDSSYGVYGKVLYVCKRGSFGRMSNKFIGYAESGHTKNDIAKGVPPICPMVRSTIEDKISYELGVPYGKLANILKKYNCEIIKR